MGEAHRVVPDELDPLAIVGTTASGKSALAMALARHRGDVELVSVDSMQVYRGMDIGTAKLPVTQRQGIPHHLLDIWPIRKAANLHNTLDCLRFNRR